MDEELDLDVLHTAQGVMLNMLKEVDRVCREHNIPYWLDHGTLLGAVRHQKFIPWDDDLDISMLRGDYEKFLNVAPQSLSKDLFLQNYDTDREFTYPFTRIRDNNSLLIGVEEVGVQIEYHQGIFMDIFPVEKLSARKWVRYFWRSVVFKKLYLICGMITKYRQRSMQYPFYRYFIKNARMLLVTKIFGAFRFPNNRTAAAVGQKLRKFATVEDQQTEQFVLGYGLEIPNSKAHAYDTVFPLQQIPFEDGIFFAPHDCDRFLRTLYGDTYMQLPAEKERRPHHAAQIIPYFKRTKKPPEKISIT